MPMTANHSTVKDDKGAVTHYDMTVDGAPVGTATKSDKGLFSFKVLDGAGTDVADMKTMRDLKVEILKNVPKAYVEANKPAPKPAKEAKPKATATDPKEKELDATDEQVESEDIELA